MRKLMTTLFGVLVTGTMLAQTPVNIDSIVAARADSIVAARLDSLVKIKVDSVAMESAEKADPLAERERLIAASKGFETTEVPEKWQGESAVILFQERSFDFREGGGLIRSSRTTRKRIKLQDQSAVNEFSQFYHFDLIHQGDNHSIGFVKKYLPENDVLESLEVEPDLHNQKYWIDDVATATFEVIKPSGEVIQIPLSTDNESGATVPATFNEQSSSDIGWYKTAIPDLEVGDIIDFKYQFINFEKVGSSYNYGTTYLTLEQSDYPILGQHVEINYPLNHYMQWQGLSVPDEFLTEKEDESGVDGWTFDTPPSESLAFSYRYRTASAVKFTMQYVKPNLYNDLDDLDHFGSQAIEEKDFEKQVKYFLTSGSYNNAGKVIGKFNKYYTRKDLNVAEVVEAVHAIYQQVHYDELIKRRYELRPPTASTYYRTMMRALFSLRVPEVDIVAVVHPSIGSISEFYFYNELDFCLRVKEGDKSYYFQPFGRRTDLENLGTYLKTSDKYYLTYNRSSFDRISSYRYGYYLEVPDLDFEKGEPASDHAENVGKSTFNMSIDLANQTLPATIINEYSGAWVSNAYDRLRLTNRPSLGSGRLSKKKQLDAQRKRRALLKTVREIRADNQRRFLSNDFTVVDYDSCLVTQSADLITNQPFIYEDHLVVGDILHAAGEDYILDIGQIIGGQVTLDAEEYEREEDIYINYCKTLENVVNIEIPSGYKVELLDALNFNETSDVGSFVSTATMDGNTIRIVTKKVYSKQYAEASEWPAMTKFLDAAVEFSQRKVILKKL